MQLPAEVKVNHPAPAPAPEKEQEQHKRREKEILVNTIIHVTGREWVCRAVRGDKMLEIAGGVYLASGSCFESPDPMLLSPNYLSRTDKQKRKMEKESEHGTQKT